VGSVFSPHYHRALQQRERQQVQPMQHCAINVALYTKRGRRWVFTEPGAGCSRDAGSLTVGGSSLRWQDGALCVNINERTTPFGQRLVGTVQLTPATALPTAVNGPTTTGVRVPVPSTKPVPLHKDLRHMWWPVAPCARVEVAFSHPAVKFKGRAYHDANYGSEPLGAALHGWNWQRAWHPQGTLVYYNVASIDPDKALHHAALYRPDGSQTAVELPQPQPMQRTGWGVARASSGMIRQRRLLEDTPFYARALVDMQHTGLWLAGMHEQVDLRRFERPWVQFLLPFRLRRRP
jgi:carotenoid 1,2-hydratase